VGCLASRGVAALRAWANWQGEVQIMLVPEVGASRISGFY